MALWHVCTMTELLTSSRTKLPGHVTLTLSPHAPNITYLHVQSTQPDKPRASPMVRFTGALKGRRSVDEPYSIIFKADPGVLYFITAVLGSENFNWIV